MGMSQTSVFPAEGPHGTSFEDAYHGPYQRPHEAAQLTGSDEAIHDESAREDGDLPEGRYSDREESWLRFNERVLELAEDESIPLLERVRFLAIFATNLDEFFMVRVASLVRRMVVGFPVEGAGVRLPREVLGNTLELAGELTVRHARAFSERVNVELAEHGIEILRWKELSGTEQDSLGDLFRQRIYPVLTPLVVDPAHPFPFISGLSLNLAVMIADPRTEATVFARVKVPPLLPRFLAVARTGSCHRGRHRRAPDRPVRRRRGAGAPRVPGHPDQGPRGGRGPGREPAAGHGARTGPPPVRARGPARGRGHHVRRRAGPAGHRAGDRRPRRVPGARAARPERAVRHRRPEHRRAALPAVRPVRLGLPQEGGIFSAIAERDILVQHPYDSFAASVERLIEEAAEDPRVLAIKQTLYRTSGKSPIVDALIEAAEAGKQVVVVVEIKARFDERANITWARKLEEAGCHVVYGIVGLKTHAKMALIVREEADGTLRRYCHLGTGNYHPTTARVV